MSSLDSVITDICKALVARGAVFNAGNMPLFLLIENLLVAANRSRWRIVQISAVFLCCALPPCQAAERTDLLQAIDLALSQSDTAYDLRDTLELSKMATAAAEHYFDTKLVPLTAIGLRQGTGSQQLGMEMRRETQTGTSLSYGLVGNRIDDSTGYVVENTTNTRAYVRLSQGLLRRWGSKYNLTDLNVAELRRKEQEILAERARQTLILTAVQRFYDVVLADQLMVKADKSLARSREHLNSATSRQSVGLVSKVDVYRAELAMLDAESVREGQIRQKERTADAFRELLRMGEDESVQADGTVTKMIPIVPESWEEELLSTRLDWQAHRVGVEIADLEIYKAKQNLSPDIGLSLTLEQRGDGNTVEDSLDMDQTNWSVQLQMLSPLDTFTEENALLRKKMEKAKLERTSAALQRKIRKEARSAFLDLVTEERNYQINLRKLHEAEMALDLAKTRYEKGLSENLEVLGAETAFSEAEINISRSLTACNIAAVTVAYNLGVLDRQWVQLALEKNAATASTQQ
jgi:outer membrane protein TolC